jgi:hypothetical protein
VLIDEAGIGATRRRSGSHARSADPRAAPVGRYPHAIRPATPTTAASKAIDGIESTIDRVDSRIAQIAACRRQSLTRAASCAAVIASVITPIETVAVVSAAIVRSLDADTAVAEVQLNALRCGLCRHHTQGNEQSGYSCENPDIVHSHVSLPANGDMPSTNYRSETEQKHNKFRFTMEIQKLGT